jgi:hypothetical protein
MEERAARKMLLLGRLDNCGSLQRPKIKDGLEWPSVCAVGGMARDSDAVKKKGAERPFMWTSWRSRCRW